jgi:hypothetical protein
MNTKSSSESADVVVRMNFGGSWSIEMPHAERAGAVFVTFANDQTEALLIAAQMRPDSNVQVISAQTEAA